MNFLQITIFNSNAFENIKYVYNFFLQSGIDRKQPAAGFRSISCIK